jgi:ABC-2 type transport system permease protein
MTAGWISWLSPIGWGQRTSPFSDPTWWPVLLGVLLGAVAVVGAIALRSSRDIDSSIIPERAGRAHARASLSGPIALVWRELRNPTIGWLVAGALFGLLVGSLSETLTASAPADVKQNLGDTVGSIAGPNAHGDLVDLFIVAMFSMIGAIAAVCAVQSVARARQDEANGTAEIVLSTAVSRIRWFLGYLVIAVVSTLLVMAVAVLGAIAGAAGAGAPSGTIDTITSAAVAQLPAVFLLLAVVALVFALVPRLTIGLGWTVLLLAIFIGQFGGLFGLPDWARDISPFSHTPIVTEADVDWGPAWLMLGIAVVVAAASVLLVRRRDVALGG